MSDALLTQEYLKSILHYNPSTGLFTWLVNSYKKRNKGTIAGCIHTNSKSNVEYKASRIKINGKKYYTHRLAWFYMTGEWPSGLIDHKNTDSANNSIDNLRLATSEQNSWNRRKNSKSKYKKGVRFNGKNYQAWIYKGKKGEYLGTFDTEDKAYNKRCEVVLERHGEFAWTN